LTTTTAKATTNWNPKSTIVPELPDLMGNGGGGDGGLSTLRLVAIGQDGEIDLWQGDTISLEVSGKGPMNRKKIDLVVDEIVYGEKAYINMLVDGGTALSGGGRSTSNRNAYVRVMEKRNW
jgi:hypothetical protein